MGWDGWRTLPVDDDPDDSTTSWTRTWRTSWLRPDDGHATADVDPVRSHSKPFDKRTEIYVMNYEIKELESRLR